MKKIETKEELDHFICETWNDINAFIDKLMEPLNVPFYTSVDIRESKLKYAPIDNNSYPAGFNNLCQLDLDLATQEISALLKKTSSHLNHIGIIPESNTKNTFYLDHLAILKQTIENSGYQVSIISNDKNLFSTNEIQISLISHSKFDVEINYVDFSKPSLEVNGQKIDLCVLNNDQSSPIDTDWDTFKTPISPSPNLGWHNRQKATHFCFYSKVLETFCKEFNVDQSLLEANFLKVEDIDFNTKEGLEKIAIAVDQIKHNDASVKNIFIKANQGTYGMGISVVSSGAEIVEMNRKKRNKMDIGKNKKKFTSVIAQEGIETILKYDNMPAEITIYLIAGKPVGGFMRANSEKGANANLNSRGMVFKKFCISEIKQNQEHKIKEAVYSILARLSTAASAMELDQECIKG